MNAYIVSIKKEALLLLLFLIAYHPCHSADASSLSGAVEGLRVDEISSFHEMRAALTILQSASLEGRQKNQFTFDLQKLILSKAGTCISRIIEIKQQAELTKKAKEEATSLFSTNGEVIKEIRDWNKKRVEDLQENKLDQMENTEAFFRSPEWQEPQYLISLASYWLSWNGYYASLLYSANEPSRKDLLDKAVEGFSRAIIDFKEESIIIRSLFGRALCYKEMEDYDKAVNDLNLVISKIKRDDDLYLRSRYEKVLISYLTGNYESTLSQLNNVQEEFSGKTISKTMDSGFKKIRVKSILALSEKKGDTQGERGKTSYREALHELKKLVESDASQAGEIYQFVSEHASTFDDLTYNELGPIGYLAIADWYFNQKQYEKAGMHYQHLFTSDDPLIKRRLDDVHFRMGYCFCQNGKWQDALSHFESLFKNFPRSSFLGKAACLNYVAATNHYKENPRNSSYGRYIKATQNYLEHCTDPKDKSKAHFQMGKYYQDQGMIEKALKEFSQVDKDSPNHVEAQYYVVQYHVDNLESYNKKGLNQSKRAKHTYQDTLTQLERYQALIDTQKEGKGAQELEAQTILLQAKAYMYGPEKTYKKALQKLNGFESRFPHSKTLYLMAKGLRMECYRQLQMFEEAKEEINTFLKEDFTISDRWTFLHDCANQFYEEAKRLKSSGNNQQASQQAAIALMLYKELSSLASRNSHYNRFLDSIQLRTAEIYMDENQTAKAKAIYQETLQKGPTSADAIYNLGLIYERENQWGDALATWRTFSKGLKPGSYYWFESRYHTAQALSRLGKNVEACEIATVIQVLYPELRDELFKQQLMKLQKDVCEKDKQ